MGTGEPGGRELGEEGSGIHMTGKGNPNKAMGSLTNLKTAREVECDDTCLSSQGLGSWAL